jgi:putative SOS response-associated peptidase YedK
MCGRFASFTPASTYMRLFRAVHGIVDTGPRYNVAPGADVLVCREPTPGGRELAMLHWGLIPSWARDPKAGYRMINARAETVAEKPAFRSALRRRRCLVAADGFYEWQEAKPRKQPHFIRLKDGAPFAFAGLWEHWVAEDRVIESCTIIVTRANGLIAPIHDRMPVILAPEDYALWLDPSVKEPAAVLGLLQPFAPERMEAYPVEPEVNSPKNDGPALIRRR